MTKRQGCGEYCDDPAHCDGKGLPLCAEHGWQSGMENTWLVTVTIVIVTIVVMPIEVFVIKKASGVPIYCLSVFGGFAAWALLWALYSSLVRRVWERLERYDSRSWRRLALSWCLPLLLWDWGSDRERPARFDLRPAVLLDKAADQIAARVRAKQQVLQYRERGVEDMPIPAANGKLEVDALPIAAGRE